MNNLQLSPNVINATWYKYWFNSQFYHQLYANRDEQEAAAFINAMVEYLQPEQGASVLDLGCGNGRHSRQLAGKGLQVTGIDLAASSIAFAKNKSTPGTHFYRHDMRMPFGNSLFDIVFNFFTSFGYFQTQAENHQVICNISDSLKPGGLLVMDYLNVNYAANRLVAHETKEIDGVEFTISRWMTATHFYKKIIIDSNSGEPPLEFTEQVEKIRLEQFDEMFKAYGMSIEKVFGNYQPGSYDQDSSPRLIMIVSKKQKNPRRREWINESWISQWLATKNGNSSQN